MATKTDPILPPPDPVADVVADVVAAPVVADAVAPVVIYGPVAPLAFDVAYNVVASLDAYRNCDPEAVKRVARQWQDDGIVPEGIAS